MEGISKGHLFCSEQNFTNLKGTNLELGTESLHIKVTSQVEVTFINNKRVKSDIYGNINEQVFYNGVHLNNRIGTRKLVTNIKHHLGLRGRNVESVPGTSNTIVNRRNALLEGPTRTQALNLQHQARNQISQPLQALNLLAEYIRDREIFLR